MQGIRAITSREKRRTQRLSERTNDEWLALLASSVVAERNSAIDELRTLLVRGLRFGLKRTLGRRGAIEQVEDFAQEGLVRILENLDSFRGESRFTTWAQKIALRVAYSELRRKRWEDVSLDKLLEGDRDAGIAPVDPPDAGPDPYEQTADKTAVELVTSIIDNDLTELQRTALKAIIMQGIPMEEVARKMGSNRNALYKLLHDARRKVAAELQKRGIEPAELLEKL